MTRSMILDLRAHRARMLAAALGLAILAPACGGAPAPSDAAIVPPTVTAAAADPSDPAETDTTDPTVAPATTEAIVAELPATTEAIVAELPPIATLPRPTVFADLPPVTLVAPGAADAGLVPVFAWEPVDGAVSYRLSVLGPDRPTWAWSGVETTVSLGLRTGPSDAVPGLQIAPGSWWSVSALGADGSLLAMSELRTVSPAEGPLAPAPPAYLAAAAD